MRDLSAFPGASFDVVFHPVSNLFCPDLAPVWREAFRVLRPGGLLLAGFLNPDLFIFDAGGPWARGVRSAPPAPVSTLDLPAAERHEYYANGPVEYSHSLTQPARRADGRRVYGLTHLAEAPHHADATAAVHARLHRHPCHQAGPARGRELQDDSDRAVVDQADFHVGPGRTPVCTLTPSLRKDETTASTSGSAAGPGAAACQDGRRPLRVSA